MYGINDYDGRDEPSCFCVAIRNVNAMYDAKSYAMRCAIRCANNIYLKWHLQTYVYGIPSLSLYISQTYLIILLKAKTRT